jgi:hypothetical protein
MPGLFPFDEVLGTESHQKVGSGDMLLALLDCN